eukprot:GILI01011755.1.p1 GENE.GILI01011755.1~~GILI01011755.1.p1  ORF type:complete len:542 (+),score=111.52 GILI01011755.1:168-1628(+)
MSGHGNKGFLKFHDTQYYTADDLADSFAIMHSLGMYNKILFIADTCNAESSSSQNITSDKHEANNNSSGQQQLRFANRFQANKAFLDQLKLNAVSVSPKPEGATTGQHFNFAGRRAESKTGSAAGDFVVANTFQPYVGGGLGNNANFNISRENDEEVGPFSIAPSMMLDSTNFGPTNNSSQVVTSPVSKVGGGVGAAVQVPTGGLPLPVVSVSGERQDTAVSSNATPRAKKEQLSPRGLRNGASTNCPGAIPSESLSPTSSPLGAPSRRLQQQTSSGVLGATTDNPSGADWLGFSGMKDSSQLASGSLAMFKSIRKQQQQQQELTQSFIAKSSPEASRLGIHQELHEEAEGGAPRSPGARNHTLSPADGPLQLRPPNPMARISITSDNAPTVGGARRAHTTLVADSVAEGGLPKVLESGELRPPQSPMGNASSATNRSDQTKRQRGTTNSKSSSGPSQQSSTVVLSFSKSELMIILGALKLLNNKK